MNDVDKPAKVLLIEDSPEDANLVRETLAREKNHAFDLKVAEDLRAGLDHLSKEHADVILLDLSLPDSNGLNTFITVSSQATDVPIVIWTGLRDESVGLEAVRKGAQEYLIKGEADILTIPHHLSYAIERKQAEEMLRKSEERFEIAAKATNDVIWDWDLETNRVWWSDNYQTMFRRTIDRMGWDLEWWSEHIHPEDRERFLSSVDAVIHSGWQFWSGEYRFRRGDGTYVSIFDRGYVVQDKEGSPIRMIGAMMDMTDRKRAEETLREFNDVMANALEGISSVDANGKYQTVNKSYAEMLGYMHEEIIGLSWQAIIYPEDRDKITAAYDLMLTKSKAELEVKAVRKDKSTFYAQLVMIAAYDSHRNFTGHYCFMKDISERKRLEEELIQSQKIEAIRQLAGGIAHDFNNVLATLLGYTRLAINQVPMGGKLKNYLDEILKTGDRATELVKQIAIFSPQQVREGKKNPCQLEEILKEIVKFLRPTLPSNIFVHGKYASDIPPVVVDPSEFQQVVVNLCINSCQAMPKGGTLTVSMEVVNLSALDCDKFSGVMERGILRPGPYALLAVEDTGDGIEKEILSQIFKPSFTTRESGAGMGLTVVYDFVKEQGGDIRIKSELGMGTRFEILLPTAVTIEQKEMELTTPVKGGHESVLIVDDEEALARVMGETLGFMGYQITIRTNSYEALDLFQKNSKKFDLVVLDQIMPGISGDQLAQEMSKLRPGIPIILCSGFAHILSPERMSEAGISKFLNKPTGLKELERAIRGLLDKESSFDGQVSGLAAN